MKHIKIFVGSICFLFILFAAFETIQSEPKQKTKTVHPKIISTFADAIEKTKKACAKNPNGPFCEILQCQDAIPAHIDTNAIIKIGKQLEKDNAVGPLAQNITNKLNEKKEVVQSCVFGNDKKSFKQFGKLLRSTTLKCGGMSCLWNKSVCRAAAFAAAAKCINCDD